MALNLIIYTTDTAKSLIGKIEQRFLDYEMKLKFHPGFSFDKNTDTGFCPFRLEVLMDESGHYEHFQKPLMTGFEIYFEEYDYPIKEEKNVAEPKKSFLQKLFGSKSKTQAPTQVEYIANEEIDKYLKNCDEQITISWQTGPELRVSLFFASFLAELTKGVVLDPRCGDYFLPERALEVFPGEILDYEKSFSTADFASKMHEFEKWI